MSEKIPIKDKEQQADRPEELSEETGVEQPRNFIIENGGDASVASPPTADDVPQQIKIAEKAEQIISLCLQKEIQKSSDALISFGNILQRRERDQLSPLMEKSELLGVLASARTVEDSVRLGKIDFEQLGSSLRGVSRVLENYGRARSSWPTREDMNNLKGLATFSRSAAEELHRMRKTLEQSKDKAAGEAASSAGNLSKVMEAIWMNTGRRMEAVSRYTSR